MQFGSQLIEGVKEGEVLAGKYRIERVLGAGGMGVVVAAHHLLLDERVAIKFLLPETLNNSEAVARFAREARAAVKIKSDHVARVIDVDILESGATYLVMEYLEGGDLSSWLAQRGVLPIEQAVEFVLQACEAIAEAHSLGIVHRDLKPANLFCVRRADGVLSVKVLDFGISKVKQSLLSGPGMGMTGTTAVMGSPFYMSPEQLQSSRNVDARTDIWSLGAVLFELTGGRPPFVGETLPELCLKIVNEPTPKIRRFRPDAPELLEQIIAKCLEKDRENRYRNVAQLAVALAPFGPKRARVSVERVKGIIQSAGLSVSAMELPPSSDDNNPQVSPVPTEVAWGHTAPPSAGRKKWLAVGGFAVVAALGFAVSGYMKSHSASHAQVAASTFAPPPPSPSIVATPVAPPPASSLSPSNASPAPSIVVDLAPNAPKIPSAKPMGSTTRPQHSRPAANANYDYMQ